MKVWVDPSRCQGHTLCALKAPDAFELDDDDGHATACFEIVPRDQELSLIHISEPTRPY